MDIHDTSRILLGPHTILINERFKDDVIFTSDLRCFPQRVATISGLARFRVGLPVTAFLVVSRPTLAVNNGHHRGLQGRKSDEGF